MTISGYLLVLRRRWLTITVVTVLLVGVAGVMSVLSPKLYVARSVSFVSITGDATTKDLFSNSQFALSQVTSYPAVVSSPQVLDKVVSDLDLKISAGQLRQQITVVNPAGTLLLQVGVTSTSPTQARDIANAVATDLGALLERLGTPEGKTTSPIKVTLTVPATTPGVPSSPRTTLNLGVGLLAGLALGAILAAVRDRRDTTVKTLRDLEALTGANPLGIVRAHKGAAEQPLMVAAGSSGVVEDFRSIRSALRYVDVDRPTVRQLVVTSAVPGEGKSVFATNLALTMAQSGLRVCLVEADLRRPRASEYLGLDASVGLSDVVAGDRELDDVLVSWHRGEITVLPAGPTPPDPGNLLASRATSELFGQLRERFDLVVVDAPPLLPVADAGVLGAQSDGVILVARHGSPTRDQVAMALTNLDAVGAHLIGTVLNAAPAKERQARYGRDYTYVSGRHERLTA